MDISQQQWTRISLVDAYSFNEWALAVYRIYDQADQCLYVGSTARSIKQRFYEHAHQESSQRWIDQVRWIEYAEFPTYTTMVLAEQASIDELHPKYNRVRARAAHVTSFNGNPIRRWAWDNGYECRQFGKIPRHVLAAYEARV